MRRDGRFKKLARFVDAFFSKFPALLQPPHHPVWHQVNLAAEQPGWTRFKPAADWLAQRQQAATASHDAGISPRLDVLRAQVDYQNEQQSLISTTNELAKDKLALARTIGLPLDQAFRLTDTEPYVAMDNLDAAAAFAQALKNRKDLGTPGAPRGGFDALAFGV